MSKFIVIVCFIIFLSGCSSHKSTTNIKYESIPLSSNIEVIEESENYTITYLDGIYYYYIYDEEHNIIKSEGPLNKRPKITLIDDNLIRVTIQAGIGKGTQWGYYYDSNTKKISRIYNSIYDQYGSKVAYGGINKVIVSDIFDNSKYHCELTNFKSTLSVTAEPIVSAQFINDGNSIKISYLSGDKYEKIHEIFSLV